MAAVLATDKILKSHCDLEASQAHKSQMVCMAFHSTKWTCLQFVARHEECLTFSSIQDLSLQFDMGVHAENTFVLLPRPSAAIAAVLGTSLGVSLQSILHGSVAKAAAMLLSCCWSARTHA